MKKILMSAALALMVSATVISCKKKPDTATIQAQATEVIASNPNASVEIDEQGVAHLSGTYDSPEAVNAAIDALKAVPGVKDVMDMTTPPAPVVVNNPESAENLQKVKDALKDFPSVSADVVEGTLTITGDVTRDEAMKIKQSIDALQLGKYENKLNVK